MATIEDKLKQLVGILATKKGEDYFNSLILNLAKFLKMKYVFIGILDSQNNSITTVSLAIDGKLADNFSYELKDTPCQNVVGDTICFHPKNIQQLFPKDQLLVDMNIESYIGFPLKNLEEKAIGVIVFLDEKQYTESTDSNRSFLEIIALLTGSELSRHLEKKELEISQERLDIALAVNNDGVYDWNLKTNVVFFDERYYTMAGYEANEFPSQFDEWAKRVHPDDFKYVEKKVQEYLSGESEFYDVIFRFKRKDDSWMWIRARVKVIERESDNAPIRMVGTHTDVTNQKNAELEIQRTAENLRVTLNSIGDAVITTDIKGCITSMNPIAENLTKWSSADAFGKELITVFNIINFYTKEPAENPVSKVLETGEIVGLANHTVLIAKDKEEYHIADSGAPIRTKEGNIIGVVLVFRDVSEDHKMQERLRHSQKMEAIGQLAGGVSHDFNNMLGGILMATGLLKKYMTGNDKALKTLKLVSESARHAANLTQQLLSFSRKQRHREDAVEIHNTIHDTVAILNNTIDKRITIEIDLNAKSFIVSGDSSVLQSAMLNLGINSSHAMPNGGTLNFSTKPVTLSKEYCHASPFDIQEGEFVHIEVTDNGQGMSLDIITKIFEPFFTTKEQGKGTGLGLSAVYGTIQQHGGAITVYSEINRGTTFHIMLPLSNQIAEVQKVNNGGLHGTGRILIVDDEEIMRHTAEETLVDQGYQILSAANGKIALDIFKDSHKKIDLVILDMIMPVLNGVDTFLAMKKIQSDVKVILSSGFTKDDDLKKMREEGIVGFLRKPYTGDDLGQMVQVALN